MCEYYARRGQLDEIEQLCHRYKQLPVVNVETGVGALMAGDIREVDALGDALRMLVCLCVRADIL
jgi:hypothetical protein